MSFLKPPPPSPPLPPTSPLPALVLAGRRVPPHGPADKGRRFERLGELALDVWAGRPKTKAFGTLKPTRTRGMYTTLGTCTWSPRKQQSAWTNKKKKAPLGLKGRLMSMPSRENRWVARVPRLLARALGGSEPRAGACAAQSETLGTDKKNTETSRS